MPPNHPMSVWGNEKTMNLNTLVLTNIQSSPYFKVNLFELKTYHEVIDEIYYKVSHLEPWEKGSRKTAGQTGMCGGVRGVGAGGIVSSAFCLLYKLYTLKLTKKQVIGLLTHRDSPYIRGLGFMYIRYTQPPADLWPWFEEYLDDEEEIDVKAGGGHIMTVGEMLRQWLVKLEWYATLFPRIPVPIEKDLAIKLKSRPVLYHQPEPEPEHIPDNELSFGEAERRGGRDEDRGDNGRGEYNGRAEYNNGRAGSNSQGADFRSSRGPTPTRHRRPSPTQQRSSASRHSPPHRSSDYSTSFERDLARERERQQRDRDRDQRRSRSPRDGRDSRDRRDRRSRSRDRKEKQGQRSYSQDRKEKHSWRSHSQDRKERQGRRSHSQDRKEKQGRRSHSQDRKEKQGRRSHSQDRKEKQGRRSHSRDRKESSSHKRSHKDKKDKHRDEKSHKHKSRNKERR